MIFDRCLCTHAEANAIMQCALFGIGSPNNWIYTLLNLCAVFGMRPKMVISVGIKRVVSFSSSRKTGPAILSQANVMMVMLEKEQVIPWISYLDNRMRSD